jgi:hypothetical protein
MLKPRHLLVTAVLGAAVFVPTTSASASTMMTSGSVHVYVIPPTGAGTGPIYITGVISDYGTTRNINANGTPDPNGNYAEVNLSQGSFMVNLTTLNKISNKLQPTFSAKTCEGYGTTVAPIQLMHGSGAYAGISGTLNFNVVFVFVAPRLKSGACNMAQNAPAAHQFILGSGTGHVTYG